MMKGQKGKGETRDRIAELLRNRDRNIEIMSRDPNFKTAHDAIWRLALSAVQSRADEVGRKVRMKEIGILRGILVEVTGELQSVFGMQCPVEGVAGDARALCEWLEVAADKTSAEVADAASRCDVWPCLCARNRASYGTVRKHLQRIRLGEAWDGLISPRESSKMRPTTPLVHFINSCLAGAIPLSGGYIGALERSAREMPLTDKTRRDWCDFIMGAIEEAHGRDWWADDDAVRAHPVFSKCVAKGKGATRGRIRDEIMDKLGDMIRNRVSGASGKPIR